MVKSNEVQAGAIQSSVIIPLEFEWDGVELSDVYDVVQNRLQSMGWRIPGKVDQSQTQYLTTNSQYLLHGMSPTFQNVWTPFSNQDFTIDMFDLPDLKKKKSSHTLSEPSKYQMLCKASTMSNRFSPILCDLMDVQFYFSPFVMSYIVLRFRNAEPVDPQYFIHTVRSENCQFYHLEDNNGSNVKDYLFPQGALNSRSTESVELHRKGLNCFIHSLVPSVFKLPSYQTYYKHQTTITSYEDDLSTLFYRMLGWADASRPLKADFSSEYFATGHKPFQSTDTVQFFQRLDGSKIAMAREGTVYHIRTTNPTPSQLSKVNMHHGRYLLIHLQTLMQSDILQHYNVETTKMLANRKTEQTAVGIESLSKRLQHFEHWMPEDIGGSSFTVAYHDKLVQMYKIQALRTDLRSTIQMLVNQYTIILQQERYEKESPLFRLIAVLLGVTGFLSLPSCTVGWGYFGWQIVVIFISIILYYQTDWMIERMHRITTFVQSILK